MYIKPSACLRNGYGEISMLAKETGEPIYITKNGEGDMVLMNIDAFEQYSELIKLRARLEAADLYRQTGAVYSLDEVFDEVEAMLDGKEV